MCFSTCAALQAKLLGSTVRFSRAKNLPSSRVYKHPITEESPLPNELEKNKPRVHALIGGPPSQGFSRTGSHTEDEKRHPLELKTLTKKTFPNVHHDQNIELIID